MSPWRAAWSAFVMSTWCIGLVVLVLNLKAGQ